MKRRLLPLLVLLFSTTSAFADANTVHTCTTDDGIKYYFTISDDGCATIWRTPKGTYENGTWERLSVKPAPVGTFAIPETVWLSETGTYPVRGIGALALGGCSITDIVIPSGVSYVDGKGFYQCYGITNVYVASLDSYLRMTFSYGGDGWFSQFGDNWRLFVRGIQTEEVKDLVVPDGTESIHDYAFRKCRSLETVTLPDSVTSIGEYAFWDCPNLRSVMLGSGVTNIAASAFSGCTNLSNVAFPASLRTIGNSAFHSCTALSSLAFQDGLLSIGNNAFWGCSNLTSVSIPASVTNIATTVVNNRDYHAFGKCPNIVEVSIPNLKSASIVFPDSYRTIRVASVVGGGSSILAAGFGSCTSLVEAAIASGIVSLGESAFSGCTALRSVDLPDGLKDTGKSAFYNCTNLTAIALPNSVTNIGIWTFHKSGIREIALPTELQAIADREAFADCASLCSVTIPPSLRYVGTDTFKGCGALAEVHISDLAAFCSIDWACRLPNHELFLNSVRLDDLVVPDGISSLKGYTFAYATNLTSVSLPLSLKNLPNSAFSGCSGIRSISISGEAATSISQQFPSYASVTNITILPGSKTSGSFAGCSSITSLVLPDGVEVVQAGAMQRCDNLQFVSIPHSVTNFGNTDYPQTSDNSRAIRNIRAPTWRKLADVFWNSYTAITNAIVVDGETDICAFCFQSFSSLESVVIPETVTNIGYRAFDGCSSLDRLVVPDGVSVVGDYAFSGCRGLSELTIPDHVTKLGEYAFYGWTADQTLNVPARFSGTDGVKGCSAAIHYYGNVPAGPDGSVQIPCEWLDANVANADRNYAAAANAPARNGRPVWECYVAGLDTDAEEDLTVSIEMVGGLPEVAIETGRKAGRVYTTQGAPKPTGPWGAPDENSRFFRVKVELPE